MTDAPEPPRRLEWPEEPDRWRDEPEDVIDPDGNWLPDAFEGTALNNPVLKSTVFRDERRWAPQHGARGRSDTALPGAFLFPEAGIEGPARPRSTEEEADAADESVLNRPRQHSWVREVVETGLLAILVFLAVRASIQHYRVEGHSMDPTLDNGEFLLVNSLVYSEVNLAEVAKWVPFWEVEEPDVRYIFHGPQRGDIVVLHRRQRSQGDLVKRIIGEPGEVIEIRNGVVVIDGRELIEPYVKEPWRGEMQGIQIPEGQFFVMGDNRNQSFDSRSFGLVPEDDIVGKALASWWPRSQWGFAPNEDPKFSDDD